MKHSLLSSCIGPALLSVLVFGVTACDIFNEPPPRYNTVVGPKKAPILNPGGEGPNTIALHQFEETERYTTQYPSPEDIQALEEAQQGMMEPLPEPVMAGNDAPPPTPAEMSPEMQEAMAAMQEANAPAAAAPDSPLAEAETRRRPLAMQDTQGQFEGALDSFDSLPAVTEESAPVASIESQPIPVASASVEAAPTQASPSWSEDPASKADADSYPKLSSVPAVPTDVKNNAATTKQAFADVAQEGAAQQTEAATNKQAVDELHKALQAEAEQASIATYEPAPVPAQQQISSAPLEQPQTASLPAPAEVAPVAPAPVAPIAPQPVEMATTAPAPITPMPAAPMDLAPAPVSVPATPINAFRVPEEPAENLPVTPVPMAASEEDIYNAPADGLAPIRLVPPSGMAESRLSLPQSRYANRRGASAGMTYRHN